MLVDELDQLLWNQMWRLEFLNINYHLPYLPLHKYYLKKLKTKNWQAKLCRATFPPGHVQWKNFCNQTIWIEQAHTRGICTTILWILEKTHKSAETIADRELGLQNQWEAMEGRNNAKVIYLFMQGTHWTACICSCPSQLLHFRSGSRGPVEKGPERLRSQPQEPPNALGGQLEKFRRGNLQSKMELETYRFDWLTDWLSQYLNVCCKYLMPNWIIHSGMPRPRTSWFEYIWNSAESAPARVRRHLVLANFLSAMRISATAFWYSGL